MPIGITSTSEPFFTSCYDVYNMNSETALNSLNGVW
jgi:hypothetical protein